MLLSVLVIGGVLLGVSSIAGILMVYQVKQTNDVVNSTKAFYAADAGTEREIYNMNAQVPNPTFSNGAVVTSTIIISGQNVSIRAQGQAVGAVRALETTITTTASTTLPSVQITNFSVAGGGLTPSPCSDSCTIHTPNVDPTVPLGVSTPLTISWSTQDAVSCAATSNGGWSHNGDVTWSEGIDVGSWTPPLQFNLICDDGAGSSAFQAITIFFTIN